MCATPRTAARSLVALVCLLAAAAALLAPVAASTPSARGPLPEAGRRGQNVVLVVVDDMRADDLQYLPRVRRLLGGEGVRFTNAYAVDPVCCPSRVSMLTGQYAHSSGVESNFAPNGGFSAFRDKRSLATWLNRSGYTTGYFGKYLNQYAKTSRLYVPPGWDTWHAAVRGVYAYNKSTRYNINGSLATRPPYQADTLTRMATQFIGDHARDKLFLNIAYSTPHGASEGDALGQPPIPALRHRHELDGMQGPRDDPAYDEPDVSDKPKALRKPPLERAQRRRIDTFTEVRRESLLAVDEGVARIVRVLRNRRLLDETTIVFVSDNGFFSGEHRFPTGKHLPYEVTAEVPLLMRGPGLPEGVTRPHVVGLHDLAPTILRLTRSRGAEGRFRIDGTDLVPFARDRNGARTGRDLLIESLDRSSRWVRYDAIRTTGGHKYVEYQGPGVELYDLDKDPSEVRNLAGLPRYDALQRRLADRLDAVRNCAGRSCR